jgi:putative FmdB family regulatory protein
MPIYEYRCQSCGEEIEAIQKFSDRPLSKCKKCGGPLEKLLSRSAFMLKGGGWYADGYKAGPSGSSSGKSGKSGSAGSSTSSTGSTGSGGSGSSPSSAAKKSD